MGKAFAFDGVIGGPFCPFRECQVLSQLNRASAEGVALAAGDGGDEEQDDEEADHGHDHLKRHVAVGGFAQGVVPRVLQAAERVEGVGVAGVAGRFEQLGLGLLEFGFGEGAALAQRGQFGEFVGEAHMNC